MKNRFAWIAMVAGVAVVVATGVASSMEGTLRFTSPDNGNPDATLIAQTTQPGPAPGGQAAPDLRQRLKAVGGGHHLAALALEQRLGGSADRLRVIDDHDLQTAEAAVADLV